MRIKRIQAENFKGFLTLDVEFTGTSVILGGMNGFGKTTIFDALELLLTGSILRMSRYSATLPNHKYSRSQNQLPLVCDMNAEIVSVSATIELDGTEIVLRRQARVADMKNPVDFTPFSVLYIFDRKESEYRHLSSEEYSLYNLRILAQDYCFLNYLSQEEATSFLKCKDSERTDLIQRLFDTEAFDTAMSKIKDIIQGIDKLIKKFSETREQVASSLMSLKVVSTNGELSDYVKLCVNDMNWDVENPRLSFEDYNALVSEGGVIDGLLYYLLQERLFLQNNRNKVVSSYLEGDSIDKLIFYKKCISIKDHIDNYTILKRSLIDPIRKLNSGNISSFKIDYFNALKPIIKEEIIKDANLLIENYVTLMRSANELQRLAQEVIEARASIAEKILRNNDSLKMSVCPLCGSEFESYQSLLASIKQYEGTFKSKFSLTNKNLAEQFSNVIEYLKLYISEPIFRYYNELGVSDELVKRYEDIEENEIAKVDSVLETLKISYSLDGDIETCTSELKSNLSKLMHPVDSDIDYDLLQKMYSSYVRFIDKDLFNAENLEKKRAYLIGLWNKKQTELQNQKQKELQLLEDRIDVLQKRKKDLKQLQGQIKQQKTNYVNSVISDIQILFYIYSGRILQDNYFGRGLFLKPEISKNRILFVSGNYNENDVDALYNMSSGQLVAVAIAFLLSLNRLYSKNNFIAIDDPVQTIDDINLWGLMETLRHDFKDRFIMLSTHEKNSGQLLDYKFRKLGISSEYIDMGEKHAS